MYLIKKNTKLNSDSTVQSQSSNLPACTESLQCLIVTDERWRHQDHSEACRKGEAINIWSETMMAPGTCSLSSPHPPTQSSSHMGSLATVPPKMFPSLTGESSWDWGCIGDWESNGHSWGKPVISGEGEGRSCRTHTSEFLYVCSDAELRRQTAQSDKGCLA